MIGLLLTLVLVGLVLYLIENYIPLSPPIRMIIRVVVVLILIVYLIRLFGLDLPLPVR